MSRAHWVALATAGGIGGRTVTALLEHFGSLEAACAAPESALRAVPGIGPSIAAAIRSIDLPAVETELTNFDEQSITVLTWQDDGYPALLMRTGDAPPVLFVRGRLLSEELRTVAVVGTRQPAPASAELAQQIGRELASRGWTVVSGLALGIDTAAHRGALAAGGRTLAVLGSGVSAIYPRRNARLAKAIQDHGAVLCEVHPRAGVSRQGLIARNRITSGLSRAVIVVQSSADSGSANTARRAAEQGRAVFAVTGEDAADATLIARGATPLNPAALDWDALSEQLDALPIEARQPGRLL